MYIRIEQKTFSMVKQEKERGGDRKRGGGERERETERQRQRERES